MFSNQGDRPEQFEGDGVAHRLQVAGVDDSYIDPFEINQLNIVQKLRIKLQERLPGVRPDADQPGT